MGLGICAHVCVFLQDWGASFGWKFRAGNPQAPLLSEQRKLQEWVRVEVSGTSPPYPLPLSYPNSGPICQSWNPIPLANYSLRVRADRTWPLLHTGPPETQLGNRDGVFLTCSLQSSWAQASGLQVQHALFFYIYANLPITIHDWK